MCRCYSTLSHHELNITINQTESSARQTEDQRLQRTNSAHPMYNMNRLECAAKRPLFFRSIRLFNRCNGRANGAHINHN